jgi:hypothetical protein
MDPKQFFSDKSSHYWRTLLKNENVSISEKNCYDQRFGSLQLFNKGAI